MSFALGVECRLLRRPFRPGAWLVCPCFEGDGGRAVLPHYSSPIPIAQAGRLGSLLHVALHARRRLDRTVRALRAPPCTARPGAKRVEVDDDRAAHVLADAPSRNARMPAVLSTGRIPGQRTIPYSVLMSGFRNWYTCLQLVRHIESSVGVTILDARSAWLRPGGRDAVGTDGVEWRASAPFPSSGGRGGNAPAWRLTTRAGGGFRRELWFGTPSFCSSASFGSNRRRRTGRSSLRTHRLRRRPLPGPELQPPRSAPTERASTSSRRRRATPGGWARLPCPSCGNGRTGAGRGTSASRVPGTGVCARLGDVLLVRRIVGIVHVDVIGVDVFEQLVAHRRDCARRAGWRERSRGAHVRGAFSAIRRAGWLLTETAAPRAATASSRRRIRRMRTPIRRHRRRWPPRTTRR